MNEIEYDSTKITSEQIQALLAIALGSTIENEFDRMVALDSIELIRETRKRLENNRLGLPEGSRLLGINEPVLKSWLKSTKDLPEVAHYKLAGLCLVLSLAEESECESEANTLANAAVVLARDGKDRLASDFSDKTTSILAGSFNAAGLAAASLYAALLSGHSSNEPCC